MLRPQLFIDKLNKYIHEYGQCIGFLPGILKESPKPLFNNFPKFRPTLSDIGAHARKLVTVLVPIVPQLTFIEF